MKDYLPGSGHPVLTQKETVRGSALSGDYDDDDDNDVTTTIVMMICWR